MIKKPLIPLLFLLNCIVGFSQIPATLSYQGLLTDANGAPVPDAAHTVLFNFYTQETGGTAVPGLARGPISVQTFKGLFTVIIGNGQGTNNAALPSTFGDTQYWIGITPDAQSELVPRAFLTAVPYAFRAQYASNVDGSAITSGTVPNARLDANLQDLADGSLTGSKVGTGISASNITTGTLPASVIPATIGVPVGTIVAYGSATVPAGWLECNGSPVSRTTYGALFTAIGITWGAGDATATFNLPDLRGIFPRGWDHTSGNDPDIATRVAKFTSGALGDNVGSYQTDAYQSHVHTLNAPLFSLSDLINHVQLSITTQVSNASNYANGRTVTINTGMNPSGGSETRPKNANVMYIIKAQ